MFLVNFTIYGLNYICMGIVWIFNDLPKFFESSELKCAYSTDVLDENII